MAGGESGGSAAAEGAIGANRYVFAMSYGCRRRRYSRDWG